MNEPMNSGQFPFVRMRRLRSRPNLRSMLCNPGIEARRLIWPVFLKTGTGVVEPLPSLPGQYCYSPDKLSEALEPVISSGVKSILLFPDIPDQLKHPEGHGILADDSLVLQSVEAIRKRFPELVIFADLDLSEYTTHGHSGIIDERGLVLNDPTLEILSEAAIKLCEGGADGLAPSGMLDGQVASLRAALESRSLSDALILSYSTKFASRFYDCFRNVVHNTPQHGSRADCQIPKGDTRQALRESIIDEQEAADILMVKPALAYLDIIRDVRLATNCPLAAYNVSGEYSMTWHAQDQGIGNRYALAHEILTSIFRAGADVVITYWANQIEQILNFNED